LRELDQKFKKSKVHAIPILNGEEVVDVVFLEDLLSPPELNTKVLIMAGGRGERLMPLTQEIPKPLIPINGIPVIDRIVIQFANQGFRNIWISLHHMSDQIMDHLGDGERFGVDINYLIEREPLGTAGSMQLMPCEENENILVCNADLFNDVNYRDMYFAHLESRKAATIGVTRYETHIPYGVVNEINGTYVSLTEKPVLTHKVSAGVNIFNSSLIKLLPLQTKTNVPEFYDMIMENGKDIGVFELQGMWIDIGTFETLEKAKNITAEI
jgi:NDP-sugar pyrophosphorylase family protein